MRECRTVNPVTPSLILFPSRPTLKHMITLDQVTHTLRTNAKEDWLLEKL